MLFTWSDFQLAISGKGWINFLFYDFLQKKNVKFKPSPENRNCSVHSD